MISATDKRFRRVTKGRCHGTRDKVLHLDQWLGDRPVSICTQRGMILQIAAMLGVTEGGAIEYVRLLARARGERLPIIWTIPATS